MLYSKFYLIQIWQGISDMKQVQVEVDQNSMKLPLHQQNGLSGLRRATKRLMDGHP